MARPPAEYVALALTYQRQTQRMRAQLQRAVMQVWSRLPAYRDANIPQFVDRVLPLVVGAQRNMAALTTAYLARQRQIVIGGSNPPVAVDPMVVTGASARNGTPPQEVYARPFGVVWHQLATLPRADDSIGKAIAAGGRRAGLLAGDDLQLTKVRTAHQVLAGDRSAEGYRRVIEGQDACGLCIVAAASRYHRSDVMPIHRQCDCGVAPIYGDVDPETVVGPATLDGDLGTRIAERFGGDAGSISTDPAHYRSRLVAEHHAELGPLLTVRP